MMDLRETGWYSAAGDSIHQDKSAKVLRGLAASKADSLHTIWDYYYCGT